MELMKLVAKIQLDDSDYRDGVKDAESTGEKLKQRMSAMTVAIGQLAADMAKKAFSAVKDIIGQSIGGYADYQQLVGGVETLFKTSAAKVQRFAEQSYKTTGLSANQYMETVTGFSASLIQGLKGDTEEAAKMADMAITDMADNANKMGTDMSSIQNAYQGFAKQNYTMLDNLKLGYGGTASEMVRLVNDSKILDHEIENLDGITFDQLVQAIHVVQTELGITGTTAKEAADTISGSKASLAASWADLLVAVAGTDKKTDVDAYHNPLQDAIDNFQESFTTYIENIVPTVVKSVANSGDLVQGIAEAISSLPTDLLSKVGKEAIPSGTKAVKGVSNIVHWLISSIADMARNAKLNQEELQEFGAAIGEFIAESIKDIVTYAPDIIVGITQVGISLAGGLVEGLFEGLFGRNAEVDEITKQLEKDITDIDLNNNKATGILKYMDSLYEKYGNGVLRMAEWKQAQEQLVKELPAAGQVFKDYGSDIQGALDTLNTLNESMRENAIIAGIEKALRDQRELLGEQQARAASAETAIGIAESQRDTIQEDLRDSMNAYAAEYIKQHIKRNAEASRGKMNSWDEEFFNADVDKYVQAAISNDEKAMEAALKVLNERYGGRIEQFDPAFMSAMNILQRGMVVMNTGVNGEYREAALEDLTPEELASKLAELVPQYNGETPIWDEGAIDRIYSPEEITKLVNNIKKLNEDIDEQTKIRDESARQAEMTEEALDITEATLRKSMQERAEKYGTAVEAGADAVSEALNGAAEKIASFTPNANYTPRAVGISYVPTNGWRAELHRGEAVLTAAENARYRNGSGSAEVVGAIQGMRQDLQNLRLVVGQKTFGRAVVDYGGQRVNDYIGESNSREAAGYGT